MKTNHVFAKLKRLPFAAFLLLVLISGRRAPAQAPLKVGDPPPLLRATTLLQAPETAALSAEALKGKVVVLEFWATWCGPCVQAIAHLNELADKFKGKPVQFVAITSEDEGTVRAFLKNRPINAWLVLDRDDAMHKAYAVGPIPHTVLIGKDGKIAGITTPFEVNEQVLNDMLSGKEPKLNTPTTRTEPNNFGALPPNAQKGLVELANGAGQEPPLFQVLVRRAADTSAQYGSGGKGRGFTMAGMTIHDVLPRAFGQPASRMRIEATLPEGKYDFVVNPGKDRQADTGLLLQQALKSAFGLSGRKVSEEMNVFTLKLKDSKPPGLVPATTQNFSMRGAAGELNAVALAMTDLTRAMERIAKAPVVDGTGLTGRYDINLKWQHYPPEIADKEFKRAVRDQLGMELEPSKRSVEVWVIEESRMTDNPAK